MILFYLGEDDEVLIKIAGDNFIVLMNTIKRFGGTFANTKRTALGDDVHKVWVLDPHVGPDCAKAVAEIEHVIIPSWIKPVDSKTESEFRKFRDSIDTDCVKAPWMGEYQRKGIVKGITQNRLALYWEMGLGKTYTIQTILNHLITQKRVEKVVFLSPPEGVINIAVEILKFNTVGITREDIYIMSTEARNPFQDPSIKVVIMTYRNLIMLYDDFYKAAQKKKRGSRIVKNYIPFDKLGDKLAIVGDEIHSIKNPDSVTWRVLDKAKHFFEYRYTLSGTPAPQFAADLWTQIRFLNPKAVPSDYVTFIKSIANVGNRYSEIGINYYYEDKVNKFLDSVDYLVSREWLHTAGIKLPDLIEKPIRVQLPPKQKQIYQSVVDSTLTTIKKEYGRVIYSQIKNKFMHLCLALRDPSILKNGNMDSERTSPALLALLNSWKFEDNGKLPIVNSLLEKHVDDNGEKVVIWSSHPVILEFLKEKLAKYRPYVLHGETEMLKKESVAERNQRVVEAFKADPKSKILLANSSVLKTSVNITQATVSIYWDTPMDFAVFRQSLKRLHRIGQTKAVTVYNLLFSGTLEEKLYFESSERKEFDENLWAVKEELDINDCKELFARPDF